MLTFYPTADGDARHRTRRRTGERVLRRRPARRSRPDGTGGVEFAHPAARRGPRPGRAAPKLDLVASVTAPRVHLIANLSTRARTAIAGGSASSRSTPSFAHGHRHAEAVDPGREDEHRPARVRDGPRPASRPPARAAGARRATPTRCRCSRSTRRSRVFTGAGRQRGHAPVVENARAVPGHGAVGRSPRPPGPAQARSRARPRRRRREPVSAWTASRARCSSSTQAGEDNALDEGAGHARGAGRHRPVPAAKAGRRKLGR